jgi:PhzF family phenazine biosynthesis protein
MFHVEHSILYERSSIMEINIFQVDAFSSKPFGGNPAVVVPNSKWIREKDMQKIANEMNVSETAFVHQLADNSFKVRYFTPVCEVDLCGHATIATFFTMANMGYIKPIANGIKEVTLVANIGKLPIEICYENGEVSSIIMQQDKPKSLGIVRDLDEVLETLNINRSQIGCLNEFLEPEIITTGLPDVILPIKDKSVLDNLDIDFCMLGNISKRLNVTGVHAFYLPDRNSEIVYARNFAPLVGINEEAATGTASGALIYYLKKNKLIDSNRITSLQGQSLNRPSEIYCYIEEVDDCFRVKVGGNANIVMEGILKF